MDARQFRLHVVRPALKSIDLWSQASENLLCGTAAQESRFKYVRQIGDGPALSFFQIEPATHDDIWDNYLAYRPTQRTSKWYPLVVSQRICPA